MHKNNCLAHFEKYSPANLLKISVKNTSHCVIFIFYVYVLTPNFGRKGYSNY